MIRKILLGMSVGAVLFFGFVYIFLAVKSPGETPPINGPDKKPLPGSIASLEQIEIGGIKQWILLRGHDASNPVLLILHGGPGSPETAMVTKFNAELEKHFVVVNWEQRGAGKSYSKQLKKEDMTVNRFVDDAQELVFYLCGRFNREKIYIQGNSWGSALGALLVQRISHKVSAFVSVGQMSNMQENERLSYEAVLAMAREKNDKKAVRELEALGEPPYREFEKTGTERKWVMNYGGTIHAKNPALMLLGALIDCPEYTLSDKINYIKGSLFSLSSMWDELLEGDMFKSAAVWEVPVYIIGGRYDMTVVTSQAREYFEFIKAPKKRFFLFENSAHMCAYEEPEKYADIMINVVLKEN